MAKKLGRLPDIQAIVDRRIAAGIAGHAEFSLWSSRDLVDEDYSDEAKRELLTELEEVERRRKSQPVSASSGADWLRPKRQKSS